MKEINVLLLGKTGVGKSTFINALANYFTYENLNDALNGDLVTLIPVSYQATDPRTSQQTTVSIGNDENEDSTIGQSSTQACRSYTFQFNRNTILRLIDTPGVGDTRGIHQDSKNFQNIMSYLTNYDHLDGICILLQPDESRIDVTFEFCVKELLAHLHRSAVDNIIFCFTKARSTFYRPGSTQRLMAKLLQKLRQDTGINVPFDQPNRFTFDNESVDFVVRHKQGIQIDDDEKFAYMQSWNKSVEHAAQLISYISQCTPHRTRDMLSLNEVRRMINELTRPLAEIFQNILDNIKILQEKIAELRSTESSITDLRRWLMIPAVDLEIIQLEHPRTVCNAISCTRIITFDNQVKIDYKTHCHQHCYLKGVIQNVVNNSALQQCQAMNQQGKCKHCGCLWNAHKHISYETRPVRKETIDRSIEQQIQTKAGRAQAIRQSEETLTQKVCDLHEEQMTLTKTCVELSKFLHTYSITPYNDDFKKYIEYLILNEERKYTSGANNQSIIDGLKEMIHMFERELEIHEKMKHCSREEQSRHAPNFEGIQRLINDLYNLRYSGPILRQHIQVIRQGSDTIGYRYETAYTTPVNDIFIGKLMSLNRNIFD